MDRLLSVTVLAYNKGKALEDLYREATGVLKGVAWKCELIFVSNGGGDQSLSIPERPATGDNNVKMVSFPRNFGRETAMIAGLDYGRGDDIICTDADLQHPPECIPRILGRFGEGHEAINMVRTGDKTADLVKNITPSGFCWLINHISDVHFGANTSDFFAASRCIVQVLKENYRERVRFLQSYMQDVGFEKATIGYEARARVAGESKYGIKKLFALSINMILYLSDMPLKLGIYVGIFSTLLGLLVMVCTLFTRGGAPSDYATIVVLICFMFAMMFMITGTIGEYIAILSTGLKDRPIYIVDRTGNFEEIGR